MRSIETAGPATEILRDITPGLLAVSSTPNSNSFKFTSALPAAWIQFDNMADPFYYLSITSWRIMEMTQ